MIMRTTAMRLGGLSVLVLGCVAVALAQQPGGESAPSPNSKSLRDKIVAVRTEIELAQLDFDAARANLLETMQGMEKADLLGIDLAALMGTVKLEMGGLSGNADSLKEMSELFTKLEDNKPEVALGAMKETLTKQKGELKSAIERKRREFAEKARLLIEKRLQLTEIEARCAGAK